MSLSTATELSVRDDTAQRLYLDLLKGILTRTIVYEKYVPVQVPIPGPIKKPYRPLLSFANRVLGKVGLEIARPFKMDLSTRDQGKDWPPDAETMVGLKRLNNIQECVTDVLRRKIPGDIIETGVWRGGSCIFMKAILAAYGDTTRNIWVADSFEGLPKSDPEKYPSDARENWSKFTALAVSLETVQENFRRYGLLDDHVKFLKGWFKDTMPAAPISQLAILRLDGDMYESTIQVLDALYAKLSIGGYIIIDDYAVWSCKAAVDDFRKAHGINEPMSEVDWTGRYWKRGS